MAAVKGKKGFQPGSSANPGGRPKKNAEFVEACQKHAPEALAFLASVMNDANQETSDRIKAATVIIERAFGKPPQAVEIGTPEGQQTPMFVVQVKQDV